MKIVDKNVCILYNLLINQGTEEITWILHKYDSFNLT